MRKLQEALPIAIAEEADRDALLDGAIKTISDAGFRQIFPAILEHSNFFTQDDLVKSQLGGKLVGVTGPDGRQAVINPTFLFSVFKKYLNSVRNRGSHMARWFYVSPLLENVTGEEFPHHEIAMFLLGDDSPLAHAHLISSVTDILRALGVPEFVIGVNNIGCTSCQKDYAGVFHEIFPNPNTLCVNCRLHLEQNPMRIWNCAKAACQIQVSHGRPMIDFLDERCRNSLMSLLETVDELAVPYILSPSLHGDFVREKILFNVSSPRSVSLGEGGNFSTWAMQLGAEEEVPMIGFVTTFEKLWDQIPAEKRKGNFVSEVFIVPLGDIATRRALVLKRSLKQSGLQAAESMLGSGGIKAQLKGAQEAKAEIALIIGQKEALDNTVILRDMRSGMQEIFTADRIIEEVKKRLE